MGLTCLPNEVLWMISFSLPTQRDRFAQLMTNHRLHKVVVRSLYHFDGQYHDGTTLSLVVKMNKLSYAQNILNGLRTAHREKQPISSPTDSESEGVRRRMRRRWDVYYWEDVYTHQLYRKGHDIQGIVNIQHAHVKAISSGSFEMVRLLLDGGARANFYRGPRAQSPPVRVTAIRWQWASIDLPPLCVAVKCGRIDLVQLLLQRGAKPELYAPSPLYQAVEGNQRDIAAVLLQHGVRPQDTACKLAVLRNDRAMLQHLLDSGLNAVDFGGPALYAAMKRDDREMIHLLESRGVSISRLEVLDRKKCHEEDGDPCDVEEEDTDDASDGDLES